MKLILIQIFFPKICKQARSFCSRLSLDSFLTCAFCFMNGNFTVDFGRQFTALFHCFWWLVKNSCPKFSSQKYVKFTFCYSDWDWHQNSYLLLVSATKAKRCLVRSMEEMRSLKTATPDDWFLFSNFFSLLFYLSQVPMVLHCLSQLLRRFTWLGLHFIYESLLIINPIIFLFSQAIEAHQLGQS